jgi:hypothetical protein
MIYQKNLPIWEQILRTAAGVAIVFYALAATHGTWLGYGLLAAGIALVVTGVVGWCPMCAVGGRHLKNGPQAGS